MLQNISVPAFLSIESIRMADEIKDLKLKATFSGMLDLMQ
jgi:hypothetical protein